MNIVYTLSLRGFSISDQTESKDLLYWYASYQKDKEDRKNAENNKKKRRSFAWR